MNKSIARFRLAFAGAVLAAAIQPATAILPASAAADGARLPRADFPACSAAQTTYCIAEVVITDGGVTRAAKWVPNGSAVLDAGGAPSTKTFATFGSAATNYPGRWSYDGFPVSSREFDGIYVKVAPANEFTDTMSVNIEPAGPANTGIVGRIKDPATNRVTSLPADMRVKVTVRLGELNPAVTLAAGSDVSVTRVLDGTVQVMTFEGNPTAIAQASRAADCDSSTSVAAAKPNQFYALVAFKNGRDPFGVDGLTGDMLITSNGTCKLSTPTWNESAKSMDFTASAPHFAPDGTTLNSGFYRAVIPAADADLLFGLQSLSSASPTTSTTAPVTSTTAPITTTAPVTTTTPPVTTTTAAPVRPAGVGSRGLISATKALTVEVRDTADGQVTASRNVTFDGRQFLVTATGFTFSTKVLRLKMGPPPNAPRKLTRVSTVRSSNRITVRFSKAGDSTQYEAYIASAKAKSSVKVKLACRTSGKVVTCTSRPLAKGSWKVTVTPVKDGMAAASSTSSVRVP